MKEKKKVFRTKTGFCHVLSDKLVLTKDEVVENAVNTGATNKIIRLLAIYGLIAGALLYFAFTEFQNGRMTQTILFLMAGIYLIFGILRSLNNSSTPVIYRNSICEIRFKNAKPGLTRSRFEVFFKNENGKIKKRLVMLPGSMTGGQSEAEKAVEILKSEGLLT